mmetsp:Transcript_6024/g.5433  ORF Transcript_6024/g.5433 Transcript_6024/m.5433 type:complete len:302 (-) Transcript_6024:308-1213(-)
MAGSRLPTYHCLPPLEGRWHRLQVKVIIGLHLRWIIFEFSTFAICPFHQLALANLIEVFDEVFVKLDVYLVHNLLYPLVRDVLLQLQLAQKFFTRTYDILACLIIISHGRCILKLKHIKSYIVGILRVFCEAIQHLLGIFQPDLSIIKEPARHIPNQFELGFDVVDVFVEDLFSLVLLDLQGGLDLLELVFHLLPQVTAFQLELCVLLLHSLLVYLEHWIRLHSVVNFDQVLGPNLDFSQDLSFQLDFMVLVSPEEGTVGTDALPVIYADNLQLPPVGLAQFFLTMVLLILAVFKLLLKRR